MPWAPRGSLERELRKYRLGHRRRRRALLYRLAWKRPGSVWAVDLADPPSSTRAIGRAILAIRDLASRYPIAWEPLSRGTADHVAVVLRKLFRRTGSAPLILKSDNGGCFVGVRVRGLLARFGIVHLRSPRAWPQYNGACEAGIGLLRALTDTAAAMRGDPDCWTLEDLEEARARASDMAKKSGRARRDWKKRRRVGARERELFRRELRRRLAELTKCDASPYRHRARIRRRAIQESLTALGYLEITSGWVRARSTGRGSTPSYR